MFHVGQKVVCVQDIFSDPTWFNYVPNRPTKGTIYTIRACGPGIFANDARTLPQTIPGVLLVELVNPEMSWRWSGMTEQMFPAHIFRPLVSKSTDTGMAILREILDRETVKEPERVVSK